MLELFFLALIAAIAVVLYKIPFFNNKYILKNSLNITQFFYSFCAITIGSHLFGLIIVEIMLRDRTRSLFMADHYFLVVFYVLNTLFSLSVGIHTVSKIIHEKIKDHAKEDDELYKVNEFFHLPLSHSISYVTIILMLFFLGIFEMNHKLMGFTLGFTWLSFIGIIIGTALAFSIQTYGRPKKYFWLIVIVLMIQYFLINKYHLDLSDYPYLNLAFLALFFAALSLIMRVVFPYIFKKGKKIVIRKKST
jgi:hypothetical protein